MKKNEMITSNNRLVKSVITKFANTNFLIDISRLMIYPADFSSVWFSSNNSMIEYLNSFLDSLHTVANKAQIENCRTLQSQIKIVQRLMVIRESSIGLLSSDRIFIDFGTLDLSTEKFLQAAKDNNLNDIDEFKLLAKEILNIIKIYYTVTQIMDTVSSLGDFEDKIDDNNLSVLETVSEYNNTVIKAYNSLSILHSAMDHSAQESFSFSDAKSIDNFVDSMIDHFMSGYSFYKTGYKFIDNKMSGLESATLHMLFAPTNHGKSLTMLNVERRLIETNLSEFLPGDAILHVTLEDDKFKTIRRMCSTFGNYDCEILKRLYSEISKTFNTLIIRGDNPSVLKKKVFNILQKVLTKSILNLTKGKVEYILQGRSSNERFSPGSLANIIERKRVSGTNIKAVFLDYIDRMDSTVSMGKNSTDTYLIQGLITQELDYLSEKYKLPIFTASQLKREAELPSNVLTNALIADSHLKARFCSTIYMGRQRKDMNLFTEPVNKFVLAENNYVMGSNNIQPYLYQMSDELTSHLIPFEMVITKAKDSETFNKNYLLFCNQNLRFYESLDNYLNDFKQYQVNSMKLDSEIDQVVNYLQGGSLDSDEFNNLIDISEYLS